jgi:hypothetical protein
MTKRITIRVPELVHKANKYFASEYSTRDGRKALQGFIENILHETENYRGFGYLTESGVPKGALPGVIHSPDGKNNQFPDDSRVVMYVKEVPTW